MVPNKAQFDDRIRNLMALAEDNSTESRTSLFSSAPGEGTCLNLNLPKSRLV
ncbi:MAG: hypothetical protein P8O77_11115 [Emcibacteraceae bacterium]|uniref:hypothetical protein n=1 Tax=Pseudemcibacter sp. TaxID=2943293 RepID=UPI003F6A36A2|nr:hypothetical protein [Emcibacteraceae bacterium]